LQQINSIHIKNFRSYKDIFIPFCNGVNTIIGRNDSGKSNILRAINFVVNNKPSGEDVFPLYWEGDTHVILDVAGKKIERYKSKKDNLYIFDGKEYKAFGQGVPEDIKEYLNISNLNINFQLDRPFLLGDTPAEVARHYNNLVNLDIIDRSISNISSTLRKEKHALGNEKQIRNLKAEELDEYGWLPDAELELEGLEEFKKDLDWLYIEKEGLKEKIEQLQYLQRQEGKYKPILKFQKDVDQLIDLQNEIKSLTDKETELGELFDDLNGFQNEQKQYEDILKHSPTAKALTILDGEIEKGLTMYNLLGDLCEKLMSFGRDREQLDVEIEEMERTFNELMPDVCPLCGR